MGGSTNRLEEGSPVNAKQSKGIPSSQIMVHTALTRHNSAEGLKANYLIQPRNGWVRRIITQIPTPLSL